MDSVSRLAAIRELPKTMSYLENNLGAYVFKGYTKLGDNTLPNLAPLITGHYAFSKEFPVVEHTKFDNHPFIWHNVSSLGGTTMFLEDWPRISTFNLGTSGGGGFLKPPTNHYMRPFYLAINHMQMFESPVSDVLQFLEDKNVKLSSTSYLCYGEKSLHVIAIDYFKRFLRAYKDDLKFTLVWNNKLSHNYVNFIKLADDDLLDLMTFLKTEGFLDNSFLFILSDHGSRVDKIRNTPIGRLEERLPLISLVVPQELKEAYPNLHENLKTNINRLTSPFDAYETIVDILNENFKSQEVAVPYPRGISLFRPIPNDRSCADAGIDEHNCVCYSSDSVDVKSRLWTTLNRAEKRTSRERIDNKATTSKKKTRHSFSVQSTSNPSVCFFCNENGQEALHESSTFGQDTRVRECAVKLNDTLLLAKLIAVDLMHMKQKDVQGVVQTFDQSEPILKCQSKRVPLLPESYSNLPPAVLRFSEPDIPLVEGELSIDMSSFPAVLKGEFKWLNICG
ncbi:unnamed protein product [Mytilus edulis]|uniref:DUF229 domain containing protein n=1 Tax=Mytilus edulis TaxID=6550 RepID=A0A8S3SM52_MYTED|nr:unnamed protein product [Mytilus edulis]